VFLAVALFVFSFLISSCKRGVLWHIKVIPCVYMYVLFCMLVWRWFEMSKISLLVRKRKQGSRIDSVPLKKLVKLSKFRKKRWTFKDGWLILEAF
jgi:hypothetical protein